MNKAKSAFRESLLACLVGLLLASCGGGDSAPAGGRVGIAVSAPSPAGFAPAPMAPAVKIFENPSAQEYAVAGVSTLDAGDGYSSIDQNARLRSLMLGGANQPRIRYAPSSYELQLPGSGFDTLVHYKGLQNPSSDNNFFQQARVQQNFATFIVSQSRLDGYLYSELASWSAVPTSTVDTWHSVSRRRPVRCRPRDARRTTAS